jgi:hypothetical protein
MRKYIQLSLIRQKEYKMKTTSKTNKFQNGDYIGVIGAYSGMVYLNGSWHRYECGGCMRAKGLLKNRLANGDNVRLENKMKFMSVEYRHDKDVHNQWLQSGKK